MANVNDILVVNENNAIANLKDKKLIAATNRINTHMNAAKKSLFAIAIELETIDTKKLWATDGFKNVSDYGEKVLGYKHAMTNNLIRIANSYIDATKKESLLPHTDKKDWSVGQLQELLTISPEDAKKLIEDGKLSVSMSTKKIREVVKEFKNPTVETTEETEDVVENVDTETNTEVEDDPIVNAEYIKATTLLGEAIDELMERNEVELVNKLKEVMESVELIAGK